MDMTMISHQVDCQATGTSASPQHISNIIEKERKVRETSVIVGLVSS